MGENGLKYLRYLNGYVKARKLEQVTWVDIYKTLFFLVKINVKVLAYNFKAVVQNCPRMDFGVFLPSDLETFFWIVRAFKRN